MVVRLIACVSGGAPRGLPLVVLPCNMGKRRRVGALWGTEVPPRGTESQTYEGELRSHPPSPQCSRVGTGKLFLRPPPPKDIKPPGGLRVI